MYKRSHKNKGRKKSKGGAFTVYSPIGPMSYTDNIISNPFITTGQFTNPLVTSIITDTYSDDSDDYILPVVGTTTLATPLVFRDPFITSWKPSVTYPAYPYYRTFPDLNDDETMRKKITKYFIRLMTDKWLYKESRDLLNYFKVDNAGYVSLIHNFSNYDPNTTRNDSREDVEKKIKFIEQFFLTQNAVYRLLSRYVRESTINWVNLPNNKYFVRKLMEEKLMKMIKNAIVEIKNK